MPDARTCPDCGSELPARAPEGLCPRCLLRAGLASDALSVGRPGEVGATISLDGSGPVGVLETIAATLGAVPRILLRDTDAGLEPPMIRPDGEAGDGSTRYRIDGEIARGGMGTVLKGRDPDLSRDVAIKVLRDDLRGNPDMVRRFVEEAQIGGQLQHPGIVPIYELGAFADRRPFFSMKLVKGHTLAALLDARKDPATDLPRLLNIFESIAQTVAYAHARGVIHRDLKPSNVMVGSFGEVQVMDWGLAKVLPRGGASDVASAGKPPRDETVIATARSGSGDSDMSHAGSALGTPSYMAPEQARGEVERVDERADVFALGSILSEILTGQPAFTGRSSGEIQRKAALGDTADALGRLDACKADPELVGLARDFLSREPEDRPRHAGALSGRLTGYLAGVQERLRRAELARAAEAARAEEAGKRVLVERDRFRLTVALAASALGLIVFGGGGWAYIEQHRATRRAVTERVVTEALDKATLLRGQAKAAATGDLSKWSDALTSAVQARSSLTAGEPSAALLARTDQLIAVLEREKADAAHRASEADRDRKFLERLEVIRRDRDDEGVLVHVKRIRVDQAYSTSFREFGIDLENLEPVDAGRLLSQRSQPLEMAFYIDDWAMRRLTLTQWIKRDDPKNDRDSWSRLIAAARATDSDPWRNTLRSLIGQKDPNEVNRLAADEKALASQPARSLFLLARVIESQGQVGRSLARVHGSHEQVKRSVEILERAWRLSPNDFLICSELGELNKEESSRFWTAAVALAPDNAWARRRLARAILPRQGNWIRFQWSADDTRPILEVDDSELKSGNLDEAISLCREAIRLNPDDGMSHADVAHLLVRKDGGMDEAVAEFNQAFRLEAGNNVLHLDAAYDLYLGGLTNQAIHVARHAIALEPETAVPHIFLAFMLQKQGKLDSAFSEYRQAFLLENEGWNGSLGNGTSSLQILKTLMEKTGGIEDVLLACRERLRLKPEESLMLTFIGDILSSQGKADEEIAVYREAIQHSPTNVSHHLAFGRALQRNGRHSEAIQEYREAIRLKPDNASNHYNLGIALQGQGKLSEAVDAYREAMRLMPEDAAEPHCNLGQLLKQLGRYPEALSEFRRGHELGLKRPDWKYPSAEWVREAERAATLEARLPGLLRGGDRPKDNADRLALARICYDTKHHSNAVRFWSEAFAADPKLADNLDNGHRYNAACAASLAGSDTSRDEPMPDDAAKAELRRQALDWLKADLAAWSARLTTDAKAGPKVVAHLRHWKADADLAGVRDADGLAKLPGPELTAWRAIWADVDALLKKSEAARP